MKKQTPKSKYTHIPKKKKKKKANWKLSIWSKAKVNFKGLANDHRKPKPFWVRLKRIPTKVADNYLVLAIA